MPQAARAGDLVLHNFGHCHTLHPLGRKEMPIAHPPQPFSIIIGCPTVNIDGAAAVRVGDLTLPCSLNGCVPTSVPGTVLIGSATVNIGGKPAARVGDMVNFPACTGPIACPIGKILGPGSPTVMIGG